MKCEAERLRLAAIQLGRNEALLRELMEKEKALREIERLKKTIFDWADLRRAAHEVLHWEALYDEA